MNSSKLLASWSKEQTFVLLQELQKHPVLYDQTHPHYQIRAQRIAALRRIAENIKHLKPNMTTKLISAKIKTIKSQYCAEKKHVKNSMLDPDSAEKSYKSRLWCYEMLKFLDQKGTYNEDLLPLPEEEGAEEVVDDIIEECNDDESNDTFKSSEEVEIDNSHQQNEFNTECGETRIDLHAKCQKLVDCLTNEMQFAKHDTGSGTKRTTKQSPNTFLGLMVETELSKVPEEIYDEAKWKIIRILENASKMTREMKVRPVQLNLPSASASTSSVTPTYNVGSDTCVTVLDNNLFKIPVQTPTGSKIVQIRRRV